MRILIELPSWLGDSVMLTPSIENLINFYDFPDITLIGPSISVDVLKYHPSVVESYVINKNYLSLYKLSQKIGKYDAFFSFRSSFRSRIFKFYILSENKFQFNKNKYQGSHQVQQYSNFLSDSLKISLVPKKLVIYSNLKTNYKNSKLQLGINPGASYGDAKRWYPEQFANVAAKLSDKYDILIFGGLNEKNIADDIENFLIKKDISNYSNLVGKTSIEELISYISNLDLFITGDSGPMHIAASFQVPTITIFGPTNHHETSQWMAQKSVIIKKNLDCQPCMKRTCPLKHHDCMRLISEEDVIEGLSSMN